MHGQTHTLKNTRTQAIFPWLCFIILQHKEKIYHVKAHSSAHIVKQTPYTEIKAVETHCTVFRTYGMKLPRWHMICYETQVRHMWAVKGEQQLQAGCIHQTNPTAGNGGRALHREALCFALWWVCVMSCLAPVRALSGYELGKAAIMYCTITGCRVTGVSVFTVQVSRAPVH